jgi:O-antigen/teichoic acid export membrane protein
MGAKEYGIYALVITIAVFVGMVFHGPLSQGFVRFYYHYLERSLANIFSNLIHKVLVIASITLLIVTFFIIIIALFINLSMPMAFFLVSGLYVIASKLTEFFNSVLNLIRKRKENSLLQGAEKALTILLFLILLYYKKLSPDYVLLILSFTAFSFSVIKYSVFKKCLPNETKPNDDIKKSLIPEMRSKLLLYISPFLFWGISTWLQLNGEKWIINGYLSTADVGIYAIMMSLVNALIIVPNLIISDFASPIIFQQYANMSKKDNIETGYQYIKLNIIIIFSLVLFSTVFTYFLGKELIIFISGKEFAVYWYLLPFLCFGAGLFYTGEAQTVLGKALNNPKKYLAPKVSIGILSVISNFFFIKYFGINGVAITIIFIGVIYVVYISYVNRGIKRILLS